MHKTKLAIQNIPFAAFSTLLPRAAVSLAPHHLQPITHTHGRVAADANKQRLSDKMRTLYTKRLSCKALTVSATSNGRIAVIRLWSGFVLFGFRSTAHKFKFPIISVLFLRTFKLMNCQLLCARSAQSVWRHAAGGTVRGSNPGGGRDFPHPAAHPGSYTMGTGSLPGVKRPGRDFDHPPLSSAEVKERVELLLLLLLSLLLSSSSSYSFSPQY